MSTKKTSAAAEKTGPKTEATTAPAKGAEKAAPKGKVTEKPKADKPAAKPKAVKGEKAAEKATETPAMTAEQQAIADKLKASMAELGLKPKGETEEASAIVQAEETPAAKEAEKPTTKAPKASAKTAEKAAEKPAGIDSEYDVVNPFDVCIIGYDTCHTARIVDSQNPDAHPLYDKRAHDEAQNEDIEAAAVVGIDHEPVAVKRIVLPSRVLVPHYASHLKARGKWDGKAETVEVDAAIDGRHRGFAYRDAWNIDLRSNKQPCGLRIERKASADDLRALSLRIARNNLRREDTTLQKAELARDWMVMRAEDRKAKGLPEESESKAMTECGLYFGVTLPAVRQWAELLSRHVHVIEAVEGGVISATVAIEGFRGIDIAKQSEALRALVESGIKQHADATALLRKFKPKAPGEPNPRAVQPATGSQPEESTSDSSSASAQAPQGGDGHSEDDFGGEAEGASVTEVVFKPNKAALRAMCDAHDAKTTKARVPDMLILGIKLATGRQVTGVEGLAEFLRELRLTAQ